jgi:hypothetical protein
MAACAFPPPYRFPSCALFHPLAALWEELDDIRVHPSQVVLCATRTATSAEYLVNVCALAEFFELPVPTCVRMLRDRGLRAVDAHVTAYREAGWTYYIVTK